MSKTILITGAGTGFGRLVAFDLARKCHKVIATVEIWPQVTELQEEARRQGLKLQVEKLDVTNRSDRQHAFRHDIDVLLSNAGLMEAGPIAEQPIERLRSMFEINVFSSISLAQGFVPGMIAKRRGTIVFISSMAGLWTVPYASGYSASKHALEAVAEGLKAELAQFGIKIATVNPGVYGTGFNDRGADTISHWYDATKNFTPPQVFEGMRGVLAHQLEPKAMADVIVDVVLSDTAKFRNVFPQQTEDQIRQIQKETWDARS
jgi:short-subunit dehydrogenase